MEVSVQSVEVIKLSNIEISLDEIREIKYLIDKAYNKQINCEYYDVLDILFELKEKLRGLVGDENETV